MTPSFTPLGVACSPLTAARPFPHSATRFPLCARGLSCYIISRRCSSITPMSLLHVHHRFVRLHADVRGRPIELIVWCVPLRFKQSKVCCSQGSLGGEGALKHHRPEPHPTTIHTGPGPPATLSQGRARGESTSARNSANAGVSSPGLGRVSKKVRRTAKGNLSQAQEGYFTRTKRIKKLVVGTPSGKACKAVCR